MNLLGKERKTKYFFNGNAYTALVARKEKKLNLILYMDVLRSNANNKMALDTDLRFAYTESDDENVDKDVVKVVTVNKLALASISGYFNNLFFGTFSECSANADSFDINEEANFNEKEFAFMVYSAMAMGWMVHESEILTDEMAMKILKMSIKYDIPMMQNYCEQYFIKSVTYSKMELLEIGDQLGNEKLMEHALATMLLICIDLGQFSEIRARLSEKTKKLLDNRLVELSDELIVKDEKKQTTSSHHHNYEYDNNEDSEKNEF